MSCIYIQGGGKRTLIEKHDRKSEGAGRGEGGVSRRSLAFLQVRRAIVISNHDGPKMADIPLYLHTILVLLTMPPPTPPEYGPQFLLQGRWVSARQTSATMLATPDFNCAHRSQEMKKQNQTNKNVNPSDRRSISCFADSVVSGRVSCLTCGSCLS